MVDWLRAEPLGVGGAADVLDERRSVVAGVGGSQAVLEPDTAAAAPSSQPSAPWRRPARCLTDHLHRLPRVFMRATARAEHACSQSPVCVPPGRMHRPLAVERHLEGALEPPKYVCGDHPDAPRLGASQRRRPRASSRISRTSPAGPAVTCRRGCSPLRGSRSRTPWLFSFDLPGISFTLRRSRLAHAQPILSADHSTMRARQPASNIDACRPTTTSFPQHASVPRQAHLRRW